MHYLRRQDKPLSVICDKKWPKGCPHNPNNVIIGDCQYAHCNFPKCERLTLHSHCAKPMSEREKHIG